MQCHIVDIVVVIYKLLQKIKKTIFDSGDERDSSYIYGPSRPRTFFVGAKLNI